MESTAYGSAFYKAAGIPGSGHEAAWIRVEPTGVVNASAGIMASGQGYETVFAQAVAEGLGVDPDEVTIHLGNTDVAPYGMGSRGARGATAAGGVLYITALAARPRRWRSRPTGWASTRRNCCGCAMAWSSARSAAPGRRPN